jgi:hypothetical protein
MHKPPSWDTCQFGVDEEQQKLVTRIYVRRFPQVESATGSETEVGISEGGLPEPAGLQNSPGINRNRTRSM